MKTHLRLNDTSEDALLADWIAAASDLFTVSTGHVLGEASFRLLLDSWPVGQIVITRTPISAVSAVEYLDTAGEWQSLSGWTADLDSVPARVLLPDDLPALHESIVPAVRVNFVAGYDDAEDMPPLATTAIRLLASHWYSQREAYGEANLKAVSVGWKNICQRYWNGVIGEVN